MKLCEMKLVETQIHRVNKEQKWFKERFGIEFKKILSDNGKEYT